MKRVSRIFAAIVFAAIALSCSTTRVLQEDQYRLSANKITVSNDKKFNTSNLTPYLKQKPNPSIFFGWNPFLSVYNWSNGKGKAWDKFVQKVGQAPVIYDADLVESSVDNIRTHLEYQGYYGSDVYADVKVRKRKVSVSYNVTLGKRYPISSIEYILPERGEFSSAFLQDSSIFSIKPGDFLSEASLEAESDRLSTKMRNEGFFDFNKNHFFFEADTLSNNGEAALKVAINEYTRNESPRDAVPIRKYYLDSVDISYPENLNIKPKVLKELTSLVPGQIYSEDAVNNTYSRLSALKIFSTVNIGMTPKDTNLVDCSITLNQSKLQGIKVNLEASSNSSGLFGISPQLSYYHKNIFRGGETLNLSFMGNFQFKFNDNVRSNEFGVSGGLSFPNFFPLPYHMFSGPSIPRTDVNISYNYQDRPEYTRNIISTSYGYSGNVRNRFFYQAYPLQMNIVRLFNLDSDFYASLADDPFLRNAYQDHFDLGSGLMLYYTTNAESIPESSFFFTRFQFDIAGNVLSCFNGLMKEDSNGSRMIWNTPYSQFVRGEVTFGRTWIFGRNSGQSIATRLLAGAGYAYGNSNALPFEKHFYAGGSNSLRGWQTRTVGPGLSQMDHSFVIPNQTGDMKLEANIEYRFNLFWKVAGALFVDAGNVWTLRSSGEGNSYESMFRWDTFGESIAANWGTGIRLNFGFLLLRLDMGIKIHDPARVDKWVRPDQWFRNDGFAVHFGVGYPF